MTTTYLANHALERLDQAQAVVDRHLVTSLGLCAACGQTEPCEARINAATTFARYGRLPRRTPGRSMRGITQTNRFGWFTDPATVADGA